MLLIRGDNARDLRRLRSQGIIYVCSFIGRAKSVHGRCSPDEEEHLSADGGTRETNPLRNALLPKNVREQATQASATLSATGDPLDLAREGAHGQSDRLR